MAQGRTAFALRTPQIKGTASAISAVTATDFALVHNTLEGFLTFQPMIELLSLLAAWSRFLGALVNLFHEAGPHG